MGDTTFERQVFFTIIRVETADATKSSTGTGFLFRTDLGIEGYHGIFLVTNKHVLFNRNGTVRLSFHKKSNDSDAPSFDAVVPLHLEGYADIYYEHENEQIDLACLNVSGITNDDNVYYKTLASTFVVPYDISKLYPGDSVTFVGYPDGRFDMVNNLPILRKGYIATIPEIDFNGQKQIVIDAQVYPGSSGSPVFASVEGKYRLLGVVTETMITNQELKTIPADYKLGVAQPIGLGIVLKTELVCELLKAAALKLTERVKKRLDAEGEPWKPRIV